LFFFLDPRMSNMSFKEPLTPSRFQASAISPTTSLFLDRVTCKSCGRKFKSKFSLKRHTPNCPFAHFFPMICSEIEPSRSVEGDSVEAVFFAPVRHVPERTRSRRKLEKPCRSYRYAKQILDEPETGSCNRDDYFATVHNEISHGDDAHFHASILDNNFFEHNVRDVFSENDAIKFEIEDNSNMQSDNADKPPRIFNDCLIYDATLVNTDFGALRSGCVPGDTALGNCSVARSKERVIDKTASGRRHLCFECNKAFRLAHHLTNHMLTHTGARPFTCFSCGRSFSQMSSLQRHVRTSCRPTPKLLNDGYGIQTAGNTASHPSMIIDLLLADMSAKASWMQKLFFVKDWYYCVMQMTKLVWKWFC